MLADFLVDVWMLGKEQKRSHHGQALQNSSGRVCKTSAVTADKANADCCNVAAYGTDYHHASTDLRASHQNSGVQQQPTRCTPCQLDPQSSQLFPPSHPISDGGPLGHSSGAAVQAIARQVTAPSCPAAAAAAAPGANTCASTASGGDAMGKRSHRYEQDQLTFIGCC